MDGDQLILVLVQNVEILTYGSRGHSRRQIVYKFWPESSENPVTGWIRGIGVKVIVPGPHWANSSIHPCWRTRSSGFRPNSRWHLPQRPSKSQTLRIHSIISKSMLLDLHRTAQKLVGKILPEKAPHHTLNANLHILGGGISIPVRKVTSEFEVVPDSDRRVSQSGRQGTIPFQLHRGSSSASV